MPLLTAERIRRLAIPSLATGTDDGLLDLLALAIDGAVAKWLGFPLPDSVARTLLAATYTIYVDAPSSLDDRTLLLPIRPVVSVTSIYEDTSGRGAYATLVAAADYALDGQRGVVRRWDEGWFKGPRYTRAIVSAGYSTVPPDVELAACLLVRHVFDERRRQGVTSVAVEGSSESFAADLDPNHWPPSVRRLLATYRLGEVGCG